MSPNLARGDEVVKEANDTLVWGIRQNVTSETCIYFKMPTTKTKTTFKFWSITLLQSDPDVKITGMQVQSPSEYPTSPVF